MKILFQGDSITDGARGRSNDRNHILGHSYPYIISSVCGYKYPAAQFDFINRGVSGDRTQELKLRWQTDTLDICPDVLSILIGINDSMSERECELAKTRCEFDYKTTIDFLIKSAFDVNHEMKLVLLEPFMLDSGNFGLEYKRRYELVRQKSEIIKSAAKKYEAYFVPLQMYFDNVSQLMPSDYWIWDSIHPTYRGHALIADMWLKHAGECLCSGVVRL